LNPVLAIQFLVCRLEHRIDKIAVTQQTLITLEMTPIRRNSFRACQPPALRIKPPPVNSGLFPAKSPLETKAL
jgi:hypothetical protein